MGGACIIVEFQMTEHSFELLYKCFRIDLCNAIRNRFGSGPPEPEDIVQEAFLKLTQLTTDEPLGNPKAYLYKVAHNVGIDAFRRQSKHERMIDSIFEELDLSPIESLSAERVMLAHAEIENLTRFIEGLESKERHILIKSRIEGKTYEEISRETGYCIADISRTLRRIMDAIRE